MLKDLLNWSKQEHSQLPWRKNRSLYRTLVSEIMLQQTTVGTVKNHFERFLERFPNIESLAQATEQELLIAWKGLGYYRRAKNLKKVAQAIVEQHGGEFPTTRDELLQIPGIGPYTAGAILSIGMDRPELAVDANLERVIARYYGIKLSKGPTLHKEIQQRFSKKEIFPDRKLSYRALNEALMDLGRVICQARKASCELCPIKGDCVAFKHKSPLNYPLPPKEVGKQQEHELELLRCIVRKGEKVLVYKKDEGEWLAGQYELPTFVLKTSDKNFKQYLPLKFKVPASLKIVKTGITKYKITNYVIELGMAQWSALNFSRKTVWIKITDESANLSTASLKCLAK